MSNLRKKPTLDKDLEKFSRLEVAGNAMARPLIAPAVAFVFLMFAMAMAGLYVSGQPNALIVVAAAGIGAYLAINIGANDVANNVGPSVGSKALTIGGALLLAAVFESAGALIAGGDVVKTVSKGIIDPTLVANYTDFVKLMLAALISAAVWLNLATWIGAPVSTTHSVVGGVMGGGIAAAGFDAVSWDTMSGIAASWIISPVLGGVIAALFLAFIKSFIIYQHDKIAAARRWVPILIAIMMGTFATYLAMKGLKKIVKIDIEIALLLGVVAFVLAIGICRPLIRKQSEGMENRNQSLRTLFRWPLIFSAALLSFAHGANDVANAIGPLAAIVHSIQEGGIAKAVTIPLWVMLIGAFGISFGLMLFGPKLIRMVGEKITKLNPMRAFCVSLSAAITVIVASGFGLPVSSTHIAVGAIFGVGFFREWYTMKSKRRVAFVKQQTGMEGFRESQVREDEKRRMLVRRSHFMTIIAAWVVTVPAAAALSACLFYLLDLLIF
ncbi:inorganic phosphate transporter [Pseudovibrio sp. Tun.PSC04-5.I4]|uniref:inorganic phosphate transporter n=1 Tax=Pseudovibrio sp. Tun.PSC04-5.I4 TaxID=1798213 RepID=UPI00088F0EC3|nr:inorganic phosphate transporter [Pseudovibrio sp. Tun.PSC04-5.I4]SDQ98771.1 inorganic phosphate transporter, PiT family [Pseudovibrio sp. Tun.PSC04-5.I4]